jgi:hypothetical protein
MDWRNRAWYNASDICDLNQYRPLDVSSLFTRSETMMDSGCVTNWAPITRTISYSCADSFFDDFVVQDSNYTCGSPIPRVVAFFGPQIIFSNQTGK